MGIWRISGLIVSVLFLAGCKVTAGTGEDDYDDHYSINGYFLDARDTGRRFPGAQWSLNRETSVCVDEPLYFETDNGRVRVYGSPAYSEHTFQAAAAELNHHIHGVLNRFHMTWQDFIDERSAEAAYPRQLVACLSPRVETEELASASLAAIAVAPYHSAWPYRSGQIFDHQLSHFVQENLSRYRADHTLLPYWFAEGQARVVAGEDVAPSYQHFDYDPVWDATAASAGSAPYRHEHYALAYRYLERANGSLAMTLLLDLVQFMDWKGHHPGHLGSGESRAFVEAFNAMDLVDHLGYPLSYLRFRSDYHQLLATSY